MPLRISRINTQFFREREQSETPSNEHLLRCHHIYRDHFYGFLLENILPVLKKKEVFNVISKFNLGITRDELFPIVRHPSKKKNLTAIAVPLYILPFIIVVLHEKDIIGHDFLDICIDVAQKISNSFDMRCTPMIQDHYNQFMTNYKHVQTCYLSNVISTVEDLKQKVRVLSTKLDFHLKYPTKQCIPLGDNIESSVEDDVFYSSSSSSSSSPQNNNKTRQGKRKRLLPDFPRGQQHTYNDVHCEDEIFTV